MYPSTTTWRSVGRSGRTARCSWTWLTRLRAEPSSRRKLPSSHSTAPASPSPRENRVRAPAEDEDVVRLQVLDELLAELAEGRAPLGDHVVRALLRNRPDVREVDQPGPPLLPAPPLLLVIPDLREHLHVRVPAREVLQDALEVPLREVVERVRPADQAESPV